MNEPIDVGIVNNIPKYVTWKGRNYTIDKIGLHHTFREGKILYHVFSVTAKTVFFRLKLNTENLLWRLEGVSDAI